MNQKWLFFHSLRVINDNKHLLMLMGKRNNEPHLNLQNVLGPYRQGTLGIKLKFQNAILKILAIIFKQTAMLLRVGYLINDSYIEKDVHTPPRVAYRTTICEATNIGKNCNNHNGLIAYQ